MGVGSYIIRGRGHSLSWESCSHGAGRLMSRSMAKKTLSQEQFQQSMFGIVFDDSPRRGADGLQGPLGGDARPGDARGGGAPPAASR